MRNVLLAVLAAGGCGLADVAPAKAAGSQFCIQGSDYPGWSYCTFSSYQQCQASASGTDNECLANPWYNAVDAAAPDPGGNPSGPDTPIVIGPPPEN